MNIMCQNCSLAWSPPESPCQDCWPFFLHPRQRGLTQLLWFLLTCDSSWGGFESVVALLDQTMLGFMVTTSQCGPPGAMPWNTYHCSMMLYLVPKQGVRCAWLGQISRHCLCTQYCTQQSKKLKWPCLKMLLAYSFHLDCHSVWYFFTTLLLLSWC